MSPSRTWAKLSGLREPVAFHLARPRQKHSAWGEGQNRKIRRHVGRVPFLIFGVKGKPMGNWRDQILEKFIPNVNQLTLVSDPDSLLLEEEILACIRERGFELVLFEDHIAFRYLYESKFRSRWDQSEKTDLVVIFRSKLTTLATCHTTCSKWVISFRSALEACSPT